MTDILTPTNFAGLLVERPQERPPTINGLIYGESAVGKTTLIGGCDAVQEMRNVLFIDIEKGDLTLRKTEYRPDVVRISEWAELERIYHALFAGGHGYKTVVVDSLDEVQEMSLRLVMNEDGDGDYDVPEWKHWNLNQVRMLRMLRLFRDLPMNVLFTSLVKEDTNKKTGITRLLPNLPGKLAGKVPAIFDNVFYYYMKEIKNPDTEIMETKRLLLTTKTPETVAKNRGSDLLPQVIIVPHPDDAVAMEIIYNGILGRKTS
jgi:hypothetical protein